MKPFFHLQSKVKYCGILMNKACPEITDNMASYVNGEKYFFNEKKIHFLPQKVTLTSNCGRKSFFVLFVFKKNK